MKAITRLAAIALSVAGVAGGVAIAQTTLDPKQAADNPDTANYPYSKNSYLKRDGTLSGDQKAPATTESATDTSRTWSSTTTSTTTTANPAPVQAAPVAAAPVETQADTTVADSSPPPRADRN